MKKLRIEAIALREGQTEEVNSFVKSLSKWIAYAAVKQSAQTDGRSFSETIYRLIRDQDIGIAPILDMIKLIKGIHLTANITEYPLFEVFEKLASAQHYEFHDAISIKNDLKGEEAFNLIVAKSGELPLKQVIDQETIDRPFISISTICEELQNLSAELKVIFQKNLALETYLKSVLSALHGLMLWHGREIGSTERYGRGVSYTFHVATPEQVVQQKFVLFSNGIFSISRPSTPSWLSQPSTPAPQ